MWCPLVQGMGTAPSRHTHEHAVIFAARPVPTRLDVAKRAIYNFFVHTFSNRDGYALATFNSKYQLVSVGNGNAEASSAYKALERVQPAGGTKLYDSIVCAIQEFQGGNGRPGFGDRTRPWVLVVLTDGEDNLSRNSAGAVSSFIRSKFLKKGNYVYVVGMGPDVRMASLQSMGPSGAFKTIHVRNFSDLQAELALIALKLYVGEEYAIQYVRSHGIEAVWAEVQNVVKVRKQAIDFMFLLDLSSSMLFPAS